MGNVGTCGQNGTQNGTSPCLQKKCETCKYIHTGDRIPIPGTQHRFEIKGTFSCKSSNVVYLILCSRCPSGLYVGETGQTLRQKMNSHRFTINNNKRDVPVTEQPVLSNDNTSDSSESKDITETEEEKSEEDRQHQAQPNIKERENNSQNDDDDEAHDHKDETQNIDSINSSEESTDIQKEHDDDDDYDDNVNVQSGERSHSKENVICGDNSKDNENNPNNIINKEMQNDDSDPLLGGPSDSSMNIGISLSTSKESKWKASEFSTVIIGRHKLSKNSGEDKLISEDTSSLEHRGSNHKRRRVYFNNKTRQISSKSHESSHSEENRHSDKEAGSSKEQFSISMEGTAQSYSKSSSNEDFTHDASSSKEYISHSKESATDSKEGTGKDRQVKKVDFQYKDIKQSKDVSQSKEDKQTKDGTCSSEEVSQVKQSQKSSKESKTLNKHEKLFLGIANRSAETKDVTDPTSEEESSSKESKLMGTNGSLHDSKSSTISSASKEDSTSNSIDEATSSVSKEDSTSNSINEATLRMKENITEEEEESNSNESKESREEYPSESSESKEVGKASISNEIESRRLMFGIYQRKAIGNDNDCQDDAPDLTYLNRSQDTPPLLCGTSS
ncbi:hypothetical protein GDO86_000760 [Hymenochirus boettgeri]|uniref:Uncharacterized protein n=1 Tax=Hymenochirus boettgeri TaxID=247094 RepID=A0A8T2KC45_9PIPI|nr:hypothetical protein GDO86_000760 [Hymenochirus boettgeri]